MANVISISNLDKKVSNILTNLSSYFEDNELAYLSYQQKIEKLLRDKIAWKLQCELDKIQGDCGLKYLVRVEWSPKSFTGLEKCDIAVLVQDNSNNDYDQVVAMFELKYHSLQSQEKGFIDAFDGDYDKMCCFNQSIMSEGKSRDNVQMYYIFFQQIHVDPINQYRNAFNYLDGIDRETKKNLKKVDIVNNLKNYWIKMFCNPRRSGRKQAFVNFPEMSIGSFFGHKSWIEVVMWKSK